MGNIAEYTDPYGKGGLSTSELGPNSAKETGNAIRESNDVIGRSLGGAVANVGSAYKQAQTYKAQTEDAQLTTALAAFELNEQDNWDKISQGDAGGDPNARQSYLDGMNQRLSAIGDSITTPQAKARFASEQARISVSFSKSTAGDLSRRAGDEAVSNINNYGNVKVATANRNPAGIDDLLAGVDRDLPTLIPAGAKGAAYDKIISEDGQKLKGEITKQALTAMARNNPTTFQTDWAAGKFDKYMQFLSPAEQAAIPNLVTATLTAQQRQITAQSRANDAAERKSVESASVSVMSSLRDADGKINNDNIAKAHAALAPGGSLSSMQGFTKADFDTVSNYLDKLEAGQLKVTEKDDPTVKAEFISRVDSGDNTLTEIQIRRAEADQHLTTKTADQLSSYVKLLHPTSSASPLSAPGVRQQFDAALKRMDVPKDFTGAYVDPKTGDAIPNYDTTISAYQDWFLSSFQAGLSNHKTAEQMLDPNSPDYLPRKYQEQGGKDPYNRTTSTISTVPTFTYGQGSTPLPLAAPAPKPIAGPAAATPKAPLPPITDDMFNKL